MTEITVAVDNWGNHIFDKLKESYFRQEYCDLTIKFSDNVERQVHRVVVNSCTGLFNYLEPTFEVEGCLLMPSNLESNVLLPIIDFMYTGELIYPRAQTGIFRSYSIMMRMPTLTSVIDQNTQAAQAQEIPDIKLLDTLLNEETNSPIDLSLLSSNHSDTKAFQITIEDPFDGTDGGYASVFISATAVDLFDTNLNVGKDAILAITTKVVEDTDSDFSDWSDDDQSKHTKKYANSKNDEAMHELLSENDSQPNVPLSLEEELSSLLHDWGDWQADDQIDNIEPSIVDAENHVSVAEVDVNSESQEFINNLLR